MALVTIDDSVFKDIANAIRPKLGLTNSNKADIAIKVGTPKYSHTPNISDAGVQNGDYSNNYANTQVVTITGANRLEIKITYQSENNYDWTCIWEGSHPSYTAESDFLSAIYVGTVGKKLMGMRTTTSLIIEGTNSVTFGFKSDGSNTGYGYYAVVQGYNVTPGERVQRIKPTEMAAKIASIKTT